MARPAYIQNFENSAIASRSGERLMLEKSGTNLATECRCSDLMKENSVNPSTVNFAEQSYLVRSRNTHLPAFELGERRRFPISDL